MTRPKKRATTPYGSTSAHIGTALGKLQSSAPAVRTQQQRRGAQIDAMAQLDSVVYAVLTLDGLVKIGRSENLRERMKFYRISGRDMTRLLVVFPGSLPEERMAQRVVAAHLARGKEYFHPHPDVIRWVNESRDRMGVPPWEPPAAQPLTSARS